MEGREPVPQIACVARTGTPGLDPFQQEPAVPDGAHCGDAQGPRAGEGAEAVGFGLEVHEDDILGGIGNGLKMVQVRLGPARLTHCMRWLGWSKRCMEIAQEYVNRREGFGIKLADRESVQMKLGEVGHNIQIGRLLTMHAAWKLDQGDFARKEVSMAKVHVANTLHQAADVAIQLQGARGYSKDTIVEWVYRAARAARLVDGADEVHKMGLEQVAQISAELDAILAEQGAIVVKNEMCNHEYRFDREAVATLFS